MRNLKRYYRNYIQLVSIVCLCTAPYAKIDRAGELQELVECYLAEFKALYPFWGQKPKHRYLLHMAIQIIHYEPLRNQWLFHWESKNNRFKNFKFKNFINLPLSMAKHHQMRSCHSFMDITGTHSDNYSYSGDLVKDGNNVDTRQDYPYIFPEICALLQDNSPVLYQSTEIVIQGLKYRPGVALLVDWTMNTPSFGVILNLYIHDFKKIAICR